MNEFNENSVVSDLTAMLCDVTDEQLKAELKRRKKARKQPQPPKQVF